MTRVATWLTFAIWVGLITIALFGIASGQERVPLATEGEAVVAPLIISRDGKTITVRAQAKDDLTICVEPSRTAYGRRACFTVGDVRTGRWGRK